MIPVEHAHRLKLDDMRCWSGFEKRLAIAIVALVCGVQVCPTNGQVDMRSLIEQALDQRVDFEIVDKSLPEAFGIIAENTGVPITISREAIELLPYGVETRVREVAMHDITLRDGLRRMLAPIGMAARVSGERVVVTPAEALLRLGRRATRNELATLQWLDELKMTGDVKLAGGLMDRVDIRLYGEPPPDGFERSILEAVGESGEEALSRACREFGLTWIPWNERIAIISAEEQVYRTLNRKIDLEFERQPVVDVLMEIGRQLGLLIRVQPGAIASLPAATRNEFSLLLIDAPAVQALEVIAGATGLNYRVEGEGIVIFRGADESPDGSVAPTFDASGSGDDPVIGRITMPGEGGRFTYEFFIRESDLPADVRDGRRAMIQEVIEGLRKRSSAEQ